jgi:hypothetical protein
MNRWASKVDGIDQAKWMGLLLIMENERLDQQKQDNLNFIADLEREYKEDGLTFEKGSGD